MSPGRGEAVPLHAAALPTARAVPAGAAGGSMGTVLVTGGTGLLGAVVARQLIGAGHDVRILIRSASPDVPPPVACFRGDLRTGAGLHRALAGTDAVVHCASDPRALDRKS